MKLKKELFMDLDTEINITANNLTMLKNTKQTLIKLCEHEWIGDGHDSHHEWKKCLICGETEQA